MYRLNYITHIYIYMDIWREGERERERERERDEEGERERETERESEVLFFLPVSPSHCGSHYYYIIHLQMYHILLYIKVNTTI